MMFRVDYTTTEGQQSRFLRSRDEALIRQGMEMAKGSTDITLAETTEAEYHQWSARFNGVDNWIADQRTDENWDGE